LKSLYPLSIALALPIFAATWLPAQAPDPSREPHFSIAPKALYDEASALGSATTGGVVVLEDDESYTFDEQGRATHVEYVVYKVLNQKGAESWDSTSVGWSPWHENRPSIRVRVIASDGSVHWLDEKQITEAPARSGEYKTFSDGKTLSAPFPAIAPGVVVEEEFTTTEKIPFFAPGHVGRVYFGREQVPVLHSRAIFEAPASLPLKTRAVLLPGLEPKRSEADGKLRILWDQGPLEGIDNSEANLPADVATHPAIEFSTGQSWQQIATEYSRIVDAAIDPEAARKLATEITAGKKSRDEKIAALMDYLGREIRYTGIEFGDAALVPHTQSEVIAHKYGDCKDKATLLVALLRASGIDAQVALLNVSSRQNVPEDLPGMGLFDHAIVHVSGAPEYWIDATDQWARLGQLPAGDEGRLALIANPNTRALTRIPESASKQNVLFEERDVVLAENGPATITEITRPTGSFEGEFRDFYADRPDQQMRDSLQSYVKGQYISDKLDDLSRTDPTDLKSQFALTVSCLKARRGFTDLDSAVAAIRLEGLFGRLPDELRHRDEDADKKPDTDHPKKPRIADWQLNQAFVAEWQYKIQPPAGFLAKQLPHDEKLALGPATLREDFHQNPDGSISAHFLFDSVKRRYTVAEATELRNKVAELFEGPAVLISFEPRGVALLRDGKVAEALASYRSLISQHPQEAVHHLQLAKVLLEAGMGESARAEARQAVALEPTSALAQKTLAQILKFDLVGRSMRPGSDLKGAAEAYRESIKLDPDDHSTEAELALMLEYDSMGRRYGATAPLEQAIAVYRKLGSDKRNELGLTNNLAYALFYASHFAEAELEARSLNSQPNSLIAACEAMLHGTQAGLAEANKRSTGDASLKETARTAGEMLMNLRQYETAADFLEAGAAGDEAARTLGQVRLLRGASRHEKIDFANTPQDLIRKILIFGMNPHADLATYNELYSKNARLVFAGLTAEQQKEIIAEGRHFDIQMAREGSSTDVLLDMALHNLDPKSEGSDATGWRIKVEALNRTSLSFYVVREEGIWRVLDSSWDLTHTAIGLEVLDRIDKGDLSSARQFLDWLREDSHLGGGDDPLAGPVFPRLWTKGAAPDPRRMKLAAASLLMTRKAQAPRSIAIFDAELPNASGERERTAILLALNYALANTDNWSRSLDISRQLLKIEPESKTAFGAVTEALIGLKRFDEALALADDRLKLLEGDEDAIRAKMNIDSARGHYADGRRWAQQLLDQGKNSADLLNSIAWFSLFDSAVDQKQIDNAIRATQAERNNAHILHTLACLYADFGKVKEARDVLLRAMDEMNLDEPNEDFWFALGRIAEQYGERSTAIADYHHVNKPENERELWDSSYLLAQNRLHLLKAQ